jgi:Domain of unknown function (DUF6285)
MADRPDARELLAVARTTLIDTVLPAVPEAVRYEVRMIASAMAMAEREIRFSPPVDPLSSNDASLDVRIRGGEFDAPGAGRDALERSLREWVTARLEIANPKALAASGHGK